MQNDFSVALKDPDLVLGIKKTNHRRLGNEHRDARNWAAAANSYEKHLKVKPDDVAIWVQLGHMLKESGSVASSLNAYREAVERSKDDADALLHYGQLLLKVGNYDLAYEMLKRSDAISPLPAAVEGMILAKSEIGRINPISEENKDITYFSVQDMFGFLEAHGLMSGIQRVQAGIAKTLIEREDKNCRFILTDSNELLDRGHYWLLRPADISNIIDYCTGTEVSPEKVREMALDARRNCSVVLPTVGQTIVLLGSFWGHGNTIENFRESKSAGVRIGAYIYDLIPISHPEFCDAALAVDFSAAMADLCHIVDFFATISDYTRTVLDRYLAERDYPSIPITTVALAHTLTGTSEGRKAWPAQLRHLRGKRIVSYISTVEGRKNHLYVINAWQRFIAENTNVPDLVFVGRKGWRIDGLTSLLEATDNLGGRVHIVHGLSDAELNGVYKASEFTVFTSFVEGWGLPVGESLLHGTPCVASSTSSIPEVGGEFVDYVDPNNLTDALPVFRRLILDAGYLSERRAKIASEFVPRGWDEVTDRFLDVIRAAQARPIRKCEDPQLEPGIVYQIKDAADPKAPSNRRVHHPIRSAIIESFYKPEQNGAWMRGRFGRLDFKVDVPDGTPVVAVMEMMAAPWAGDCTITITDGAFNETDQYPRGLRIDQLSSSPIRLKMTSYRGQCSIRFVVKGSYDVADRDKRDFVVGLRRIGYAADSDLIARHALFEDMNFQPAHY